jgi:hypothetical protein
VRCKVSRVSRSLCVVPEVKDVGSPRKSVGQSCAGLEDTPPQTILFLRI